MSSEAGRLERRILEPAIASWSASSLWQGFSPTEWLPGALLFQLLMDTTTARPADSDAGETRLDGHRGARSGWLVCVSVVLLSTAASAAWEGVPSPFAATSEMSERAAEAARVPGGDVREVEAIVDLIFAERDGLGFRYRRKPTLTAEEAYREHSGNCLSLVNLFVALARSAGIQATFVEVEDFEVFYREKGTVVRSDHIVGGVRVGNELLTVDFLPGRAKRYRRFNPISDQRATAHYYKAIATEALIEGELERAEALFDQALAVDPEFAATWNNYAILKRRQDDYSAAFAALEKALALEPELLPALENLSGLYLRSGQRAEAEATKVRILELKTRNPYFLLAEAERMIETDRYDEASKILHRARGLDSAIPEIYLNLAKIELASGHRRRADRLFEKARQKSIAFSKRFQTGIQAKINFLLAEG